MPAFHATAMPGPGVAERRDSKAVRRSCGSRVDRLPAFTPDQPTRRRGFQSWATSPHAAFVRLVQRHGIAQVGSVASVAAALRFPTLVGPNGEWTWDQPGQPQPTYTPTEDGYLSGSDGRLYQDDTINSTIRQQPRSVHRGSIGRAARVSSATRVSRPSDLRNVGCLGAGPVLPSPR